ncbi:MAG: heavy-metal-associated domain-containing protein [Gemmatimonadaceae bacterium]|nr:heavy-metal-associated domain-containing protein [Gemmatimonadaceae bacterium]
MTMRIEGMSCGHCVKAVSKALGALPGVAVDKVEVGSATVTFDPGATPAERVRRAVEDEGYRVVGAA